MASSMYSDVWPMNRSMISASVSGQPSSARNSASTRMAMRSLSTSTPSGSKLTSSNPVATRVAVLDRRVGGVEQLEDVVAPEGVQLGREGGRAQVEPELVAAAGVQ